MRVLPFLPFLLLLASCSPDMTAPAAAAATLAPVYASLTLGVVVHAMTAIDAAAIAALGLRWVRLSWYGDTSALQPQLAAAAAYGLSAIVVTEAPVTSELLAFLAGYSGVTLQLENEPTDLTAYGARFRAFVQANPGMRVIPAGVASGTPASALAIAIATGIGDAGVLCLHCYGDPLASAVTDRLRAAQAAGWGGQVWLTEIGCVSGNAQRAELADALNVTPATVPTFLYAWISAGDNYTLTPDTRTMLQR